MKFILFVEGYTEKAAIPEFLKRWLDRRLNKKIGIKTVRFNGWPEMVDDIHVKAPMYLNSSSADKIIGVIGLLDLYGPTIYPKNKISAKDRMEWAIAHFQKKVGDDRFRMFFAVHEVEAWLLSDPNIFPGDIKSAFPGTVNHPEKVNFNTPPSKLLDQIYKKKTNRSYKKVTYGKKLFSSLDPDLPYKKCPYFKSMLDEMLKMAKNKGL